MLHKNVLKFLEFWTLASNLPGKFGGGVHNMKGVGKWPILSQNAGVIVRFGGKNRGKKNGERPPPPLQLGSGKYSFSCFRDFV